MSQKNLNHLERIKDAIQSSKIQPEQKTQAVKTIEQWYTEDKGMKLLGEQLMKISVDIRPILVEIGLL